MMPSCAFSRTPKIRAHFQKTPQTVYWNCLFYTLIYFRFLLKVSAESSLAPTASKLHFSLNRARRSFIFLVSLAEFNHPEKNMSKITCIFLVWMTVLQGGLADQLLRNRQSQQHPTLGGRHIKHSAERIDVWVPSFKNTAWTVFNIKNMFDFSRSPSSLAIRVICMTPGENKCRQLQNLVDTAFPSHIIKVHDLSIECAG
jgi:hypothetical protein